LCETILFDFGLMPNFKVRGKVLCETILFDFGLMPNRQILSFASLYRIYLSFTTSEHLW